VKDDRAQTIVNLRGEVEFRRKLARQHVTGEVLLPDYYLKEEHDKVLLDRVNATSQDMTRLVERGIGLSPFLELGAERCHRSLVLTNDFGAEGFAVDISLHQLETAEHFASLFHRPKQPYRVCGDVAQLPFKDHSFPFIFGYSFLHHFPSPGPVLREIHRVLGNGYFFFDEEPFRRPHVYLYKQGHKV
jgi:SAM-dependent methyltransferase